MGVPTDAEQRHGKRNQRCYSVRPAYGSYFSTQLTPESLFTAPLDQAAIPVPPIKMLILLSEYCNQVGPAAGSGIERTEIVKQIRHVMSDRARIHFGQDDSRWGRQRFTQTSEESSETGRVGDLPNLGRSGLSQAGRLSQFPVPVPEHDGQGADWAQNQQDGSQNDETQQQDIDRGSRHLFLLTGCPSPHLVILEGSRRFVNGRPLPVH